MSKPGSNCRGFTDDLETFTFTALLTNQGGSPIHIQETGSETPVTNDFVVVPGVAGPTRHKSQRAVPGVGHAVPSIRRNEMQAAGRHAFHSGPAVLIHQNQRTLPLHGSVV